MTPENYKERLAFYADKYGATHELSPIPHGEELHRNPFEEAEEMAPGRVITIDPESADGPRTGQAVVYLLAILACLGIAGAYAYAVYQGWLP